MAELNYEAIGRCKVLKERIDELSDRRNQQLGKLSDTTSRLIRGLYQLQEGIPTLDMAHMNTLLANIASADNALRQVISEFNSWCQRAGEEPIKWCDTPQR